MLIIKHCVDSLVVFQHKFTAIKLWVARMDLSMSDTTEERQLVIKVLKAALETIGSVVGRNTEIVLHDLTKPENSVIDIVNGHLSGRSIGSSVLSGPKQDLGFKAVINSAAGVAGNDPVMIPNYQTTASDGRVFNSSTVVFRDATGPYASLCVNADLNGLKAAHACLEQILGTATRPEEKVGDQPDLELLMKEIIQETLPGLATTDRAMNKKAKIEAVRQMQERGLFIVKGGVEKAAAALGVTRYTIYNYLDEIRRSQNGSLSI